MEPVKPLGERLVQAGLVAVKGEEQTRSEVVAALAGTPLFDGLDAADLDLLCNQIQVFDAQPGVRMIDEGDPGDFLMLVLSGSIDVLHRNRNGYPSRIAVAGAGEALGEMSMFDGEPRFAACVALEPTRVAILPRDALTGLFDAQPALGNRVLLRLAHLLSARLQIGRAHV